MPYAAGAGTADTADTVAVRTAVAADVAAAYNVVAAAAHDTFAPSGHHNPHPDCGS